MKAQYTIVLLIVLIVVFFGSTYIVNETEQVIITQFGKPIGDAKKEPGLKFKIPFIQKATYFPNNLLDWDGETSQIPTLDKTYLLVDTFARWKIVDPLVFFQTVTNLQGAYSRLDDIIDSAVRNLITSYSLIETVRMTDRELDTSEIGLENQDKGVPVDISAGRQEITNSIRDQAQPKLEKFGIELVDVKVKMLNYVDEVQQSVYARMIAERKQIAEKYRSEGQGEARKIEGDMEKEMKRITSEAYKTAEEIKGKADAEATLIYAKAFGKDPDFYSFLQTLESYKESIDKDTFLILSTDSEFLQYLKDYSGK
ncbi:MAG: protease modulator HflC [Deltaproteobacteria bacterium]|nr:protease modulator HflC [Deltaproteobacteria bacterium]